MRVWRWISWSSRVEPFARQRVERPERLVAQQDPRLRRQRAGKSHALLHAARQLVHAGAGERLQVHRAPGGAPRCRGARRSARWRCWRRPKQTLSRTVSHGKSAGSWKIITRSGPGPPTGSPSSEHPAGCRELETGHQVQQRGLAAARRPDQHHEFAVVVQRASPVRARRREARARSNVLATASRRILRVGGSHGPLTLGPRRGRRLPPLPGRSTGGRRRSTQDVVQRAEIGDRRRGSADPLRNPIRWASSAAFASAGTRGSQVNSSRRNAERTIGSGSVVRVSPRGSRARDRSALRPADRP